MAQDGLFDDVFARGAGAPSGGAAQPSSFFDDVFSPAEGSAGPPVPTPRPTQASYGNLERFVDSLNLGFGPELGAAAWRLRGASPEQALSHELELKRAREEYARAQPGASLAYDLLGGLAPSIATLGAGGEGLAALAPRGAEALERLRSAGWLGRRAQEALVGGAGGAALGALPSGESEAPLGERLRAGALTGALGTPVLGSALEPLLSKISPLAARSAQGLRGLGVDVPAGTVPGAPAPLAWMNSLYGDSGAEGRKSLTDAALATVGAQGKPFTSETARGVYSKLGDQFAHFADMAKDADLHDTPFRQGIGAILRDAAAPGSGISEEGYQKLEQQARTILGEREPNPISGKTYLQLTRSGAPLDRLTRDREVGDYASRMWDELNSSLERHVASGLGRWVPAGEASAAPGATAPELYAGLQGPAAARAQLTAGLPEGGLKWAQKRDPAGRFASGAEPWHPGFTNREENLPAVGPYRPNFQWNGPGAAQAPLEGTLENGAAHPTEPGLEWQYDPGAEGLVHLLRDTRSRWRNMKVLEPLVDDTTGEINNPAALARRVDRAFGKSPRSQLAAPSQDLIALGQADNFIPAAGGSAPPPAPGLLKRLAKGAVLPGAAVLAGEAIPLMHEAATNWKPLLLGGAGLLATGALGRGANRLVQGPWNTSRLLENALAERGATALPWAQLLGGPAVRVARPEGEEPAQ